MTDHQDEKPTLVLGGAGKTGRNADTTDGVRRALGREARDFRDYARNVAATGLWSESAVNA
jgi:hypothetical protein